MNGSNGTTDGLTLPQLLLLAAADLKQPFGQNDLVKQAWVKFPKRFSLAPYDLPCSNTALAGFMGRRGLVRRGWFQKTAPKVYALTRPGLVEVERIRNGGGRAVLNRVAVPKAVEPTLAAILDSAAYKAMVNGDAWLARLTAVDAERFRFLLNCRFDHDGKKLGAVDVARACLVPDDEGVPVATLSSGRVVIEEDLMRVEDVVRWVESPARAWNRNRRATA